MAKILNVVNTALAAGAAMGAALFMLVLYIALAALPTIVILYVVKLLFFS